MPRILGSHMNEWHVYSRKTGCADGHGKDSARARDHGRYDNPQRRDSQDGRPRHQAALGQDSQHQA